MKRLTIFSFLLSIAIVGLSQAPEIEWQNTIGGNASDILVGIEQTDDGYIIGGTSGSGISGDKTEGSLGSNDFWIVKLNSFGSIIWQNVIGGSGNENLTSIQKTEDGGFIAAGYSNSPISGDKIEASLAGSYDYWVVKLDNLGNVEWQNTIGGAGNDELRAIGQTSDGGYILGGRSNSPISGDKTESSDEYYDYWIVKINSLGDVLWENTIGGDEYDYLYCVEPTQDNGAVIGGYSTSSVSGDKTEAWLGSGGDFWILKIDEFGNIEWQNTIGGDDPDWPFCITTNVEGQFIIKGYSESGISVDKTEINQGYFDYWTIKLDDDGNILWQKTLGGAYTDISKISQNNIIGDENVFAGYSLSGISGDKTEANIGFEDYWVVLLDSLGEIEWQLTMGGWLGDFLTSINKTSDNGYIIGGYSASPISGNKTEESLGSSDFWIIKLAGDCALQVFYSDLDNDGWGNYSDSILSCFPPIGFVSNNLDCNDSLSIIYPGATELCNSLDDNCNVEIDEGISINIFYIDSDADDFGNIDIFIASCLEIIDGYVLDSTDCNDLNTYINPIAIEICNDLDDNCNLEIDEELLFNLFYIDEDEDTFGNPEIFLSSCLDEISGYVIDSSDCNDLNSLIHPGAAELCDGIDNDCDGIKDDDLAFTNYYKDFDTDSFGDIEIDSFYCLPLVGYVLDSTDCDDTNAEVYPGSEELLNGIDDNCNLLIDEGLDISELYLNKVKIYPIPALDYINLEINFQLTNPLYLSIFDATKRLVLINALQTINNPERIAIQNFPNGLYYVVISSNDFYVVKQFLKQ